jgi:DNA-binding beta-propeller fold protein YncE
MLKHKIKHRLSGVVSCLVAAIVLISTIATPAYAASMSESDYVTEDSRRIPIPKTYEVENVINNIGSLDGQSPYLKEPQDLFVSKAGFLYVADTANNRIVKLTTNGKVQSIYTGPTDKPFKAPEGVFVDDSSDLYVADTGNARVVHLSDSGKFIEQFVAPKSELIDDSTPFYATKVTVSDTGLIYLLRGENILMMDSNNNFRGYFGQTKIGYSAIETLLRLVASENQKKFMTKRLAATYNNITSANNFIYATSMDEVEGEVKQLNSIGENVYRKYKSAGGGFDIFANLKKKFRADLIKKSFRYGEVFDDEGNFVEPVFRDVAVDKNGIVSTIEERTGKVYQYDMEGNYLLTAFGGIGENQGKFNCPSSIGVDAQGKLYVLDKLNNNIQVFKPTDFIKKVQQAVVAYSEGSYDEAYKCWQQVLQVDENYELAHVGMGNALYKQEKYKEAMDAYKVADDRANYSKAFDEYRYEVLRNNFVFVVIALLVIILFLIFAVTKIKKAGAKATHDFIFSKGSDMGIWQGIKIGFNVLFHPLDTFEAIKVNSHRITIIPAIIIFFAVLVVRIAYIFIIHYPLASIDVADANLIFEAVKILLAPLTWVIASFAITSIIDGESKPKEIFLTAAYCMIPYIALNLPLMFMTNVMSQSEQFWFVLVTNIASVWIYILFFFSLKVLNGYSFGKTILTYILSGFAIVLIWFIALLVYVLSLRLYQFILGIITEIRVTWF